MPTYIALLNWTQQGAEQVKNSPNRLDAGRELFKSMGAELRAAYLTMGRHDFVCVIEAPDDATFARAMLTMSSKGMTTSETLKAFSEDEYRRIIDSL